MTNYVYIAASTGLACTGMLYWLVKRRSMRMMQAEKLEQMKKKLQSSVISNKKSASQVTASIQAVLEATALQHSRPT